MVQAFLPFIAATRIQSARAAGADPGFRKGGGGGVRVSVTWYVLKCGAFAR